MFNILVSFYKKKQKKDRVFFHLPVQFGTLFAARIVQGDCGSPWMSCFSSLTSVSPSTNEQHRLYLESPPRSNIVGAGEMAFLIPGYDKW